MGSDLASVRQVLRPHSNIDEMRQCCSLPHGLRIKLVLEVSLLLRIEVILTTMHKSSYTVSNRPVIVDPFSDLDDFAGEIISRTSTWSREGIQGHPIRWVDSDSMCSD